MATPWPLWVTLCLVCGAGLYTLGVLLLGAWLGRREGAHALAVYQQGQERDGGCFVRSQQQQHEPE